MKRQKTVMAALAGATMALSGCVAQREPIVYSRFEQPAQPQPQIVYSQPPGQVVTAPAPVEQPQPPPPPQPAPPPSAPVVQQAPPPQVVQQAPPPPQVEVIPVAPSVEYVWAPGYWVWSGRWVWMPGRWMFPPRHHAIWIGPGWVHEGRGYRYHPGHWR